MGEKEELRGRGRDLCGVFYICVFCNRMVRGSGLFVKRVPDARLKIL